LLKKDFFALANVVRQLLGELGTYLKPSVVKLSQDIEDKNYQNRAGFSVSVIQKMAEKAC